MRNEESRSATAGANGISNDCFETSDDRGESTVDDLGKVALPAVATDTLFTQRAREPGSASFTTGLPGEQGMRQNPTSRGDWLPV